MSTVFLILWTTLGGSVRNIVGSMYSVLLSISIMLVVYAVHDTTVELALLLHYAPLFLLHRRQLATRAIEGESVFDGILAVGYSNVALNSTLSVTWINTAIYPLLSKRRMFPEYLVEIRLNLLRN